MLPPSWEHGPGALEKFFEKGIDKIRIICYNYITPKERKW